MLHLGPGSSRQAGSLLPRMFPRGIPRQHYPSQSQVPSGPCGSRASRMSGSLSLASSGHPMPHGQPGGGTRPPGSAPLHRLPARRPPPASRRKEAPRPGLRHRVSCLTPCLRPPRIPSRCSGNCASGTSFVSATSAARAATSGPASGTSRKCSVTAASKPPRSTLTSSKTTSKPSTPRPPPANAAPQPTPPPSSSPTGVPANKRNPVPPGRKPNPGKPHRKTIPRNPLLPSRPAPAKIRSAPWSKPRNRRSSAAARAQRHRRGELAHAQATSRRAGEKTSCRWR